MQVLENVVSFEQALFDRELHLLNLLFLYLIVIQFLDLPGHDLLENVLRCFAFNNVETHVFKSLALVDKALLLAAPRTHALAHFVLSCALP